MMMSRLAGAALRLVLDQVFWAPLFIAGFISALFGSWFGFIIPGSVWFVLNKGTWFRGGKNIALAFVNAAQITIGLLVFGLGLYSSGTSMATGSVGQVWSCADNSNSS